MNGQNDFALMRKPSSAVEKAAPGAKRILSSMVADALTLARKARPIRIIMVNDERSVNVTFDFVIRSWFKDVVVLSFDNAITALEELSRTDFNLLITDDIMPGMRGEEFCRNLLERGGAYPIIVNSPWQPTEQWVQKFAKHRLNVLFLPLPCDIENLLKALETALKIPRNKQPTYPVSAIK
jgi:DNA-binding NtrC family response regulator